MPQVNLMSPIFAVFEKNVTFAVDKQTDGTPSDSRWSGCRQFFLP